MVLLRSEESGGAVAVIEVGSSAGFAGPPLHHHDFDGAFYVLEGELTFRLRDDPPEWALQPIPDVQRVGEQIPL
jgi:quercetin dioxygenase-like cupin family protein